MAHRIAISPSTSSPAGDDDAHAAARRALELDEAKGNVAAAAATTARFAARAPIE